MLQHAALVGLRREAGARLLPVLARGVASWAKFNPTEMSGTKPATVSNLGEPRRRRLPAACSCAAAAACSSAADAPVTLPSHPDASTHRSIRRVGAG